MLSWVVRIDQHPPLYYILLHFWMKLGDNAVTARSLSALTGALTIPAIYWLGRRLAGRDVGLLAALLLALSPFHVRFAQETRMYTLLTLNATLALLALACLLTDPRAAKAPLGQQLRDFFRTWRAARPAETCMRSETGAVYHQNFRETSAGATLPPGGVGSRFRRLRPTWPGWLTFSSRRLLCLATIPPSFFPLPPIYLFSDLCYGASGGPAADPPHPPSPLLPPKSGGKRGGSPPSWGRRR